MIEIGSHSHSLEDDKNILKMTANSPEVFSKSLPPVTKLTFPNHRMGRELKNEKHLQVFTALMNSSQYNVVRNPLPASIVSDAEAWISKHMGNLDILLRLLQLQPDLIENENLDGFWMFLLPFLSRITITEKEELPSKQDQDNQVEAFTGVGHMLQFDETHGHMSGIKGKQQEYNCSLPETYSHSGDVKHLYIAFSYNEKDKNQCINLVSDITNITSSFCYVMHSPLYGSNDKGNTLKARQNYIASANVLLLVLSEDTDQNQELMSDYKAAKDLAIPVIVITSMDGDIKEKIVPTLDPIYQEKFKKDLDKSISFPHTSKDKRALFTILEENLEPGMVDEAKLHKQEEKARKSKVSLPHIEVGKIRKTMSQNFDSYEFLENAGLIQRPLTPAVYNFYSSKQHLPPISMPRGTSSVPGSPRSMSPSNFPHQRVNSVSTERVRPASNHSLLPPISNPLKHGRKHHSCKELPFLDLQEERKTSYMLMKGPGSEPELVTWPLKERDVEPGGKFDWGRMSEHSSFSDSDFSNSLAVSTEDIDLRSTSTTPDCI